MSSAERSQWNRPRNKLLLAQVLVVGAIVAQTIGFLHARKMRELKMQYQARHGPFDIPEAIDYCYLLGRVLIPVVILGLGLQLVSAVIFWCNRDKDRYVAKLIFWTTWFLGWGLVLGWAAVFDM